jgi:hypothetical protein
MSKSEEDSFKRLRTEGALIELLKLARALTTFSGIVLGLR